MILILISLVPMSAIEFEMKSECSTGKEISRRVDIKGEKLEVCAVSDKNEKKEFNAVSVITPWFGAGHLRSKGLLTESMNPCGYSPASEIFFEPCTLVLDRSISESGFYGIFVRPMIWLTLFSLGTPEEQYIRGFISRYSIQDFSLYLLLENSDIQEYSSLSSWYLSKPEAQGGSELWNLLLNCILEKEWFLFSITAGIEAGDYVERGFFSREYITFFYSSLFELNFMFAGTTEQYLAPGGEIPASQYKYGTDIWIRPWRPFKISGVWYTDFKRPDKKDLYYNDYLRHLALQSSLDIGNFSFAISFTADTIFDNTSKTLEKKEYKGSAVWDCDVLRLSITNQWYFEDDRYCRDVITSGFKLYFDYFQAGFTWKRDIGNEILDTFSLELLAKLDHVRLKLSYKTNSDKSSLLTFGGTINY